MSKALQEVTGQDGLACVRNSDIKGFGVLKRDVLSMNALGNEYYLATVRPGCTDLGTAAHAIFESRFGEVCGGGMHTLTTGGSQCQIQSVFEFENREQAFAAHEQALTYRENSRRQSKAPKD